MHAIRTLLAPMLALAILGCGRPEPLTPEIAREIVSSRTFRSEPVYAEVPQRVWWDASSPKDEYDGKAVQTLRNLQRAGLVTVKETVTATSAEYLAAVTSKGFRILGTAPSVRGPVFRGLICQKRYDGLRGFVRHPTQPTVGHAELVWHYEQPTWLYPLFATKIDKPIGPPFASHISFWFEGGQWRFDVNVRKVKAETNAER